MSPRSFVSGPGVFVSGRVAVMLEHHLGRSLTDVRQRFRGKDAEFDDTLLGLHTAAVMFVDELQAGSANGTQVVPTPEPPAQSSVMTVEHIADHVEITTRAVRKAALEGRLRGCKRGGRWQFDPDDVATWLATRPQGMR